MILLMTIGVVIASLFFRKTEQISPENKELSALAQGQDAFERRSWQRAEHYLKLAINEQSDEARYYLASLWNQSDEHRTQHSTDEYLDLLKPLLAQEDLRAGREMGIHLIQQAENRTHSKDYDKAEILNHAQFYLEPVAQSGDAFAEYLLGWTYLNLEVPQLDLARQWLTKASETLADGRPAYYLALSYLNEIDNFDSESFMSALEKACDKNFSPAQDHLGRFLFYPNPWIKTDLEKSREYFEKASKAGDLSSMYHLGLWYISNELDDAQGLEWLKIAAKFGHGEAAYYLGRRAEQAYDGSYARIVEYYESAGRLGCALGYNRLGLLYLEGGYGLPIDIDISRSYFERAAEQGCAAAENNLGLCYFYGIFPSDRTDQEAKTWFEKAKAHGDLNAAHNLMIMETMSLT